MDDWQRMNSIKFPQLPVPQTGAWTVSSLTHYIKQQLESDGLLQDVWLTGEISNLSRAASGHLYFTLKDAGAALSCVMWRSDAGRLTEQPAQGDAVLAHGRVSVYAARGVYQLYADELRPAGLGDLHARFERLRAQLRAEGLFDAERKRPLPEFPRVLGIVTSPQAAALRDVLNVLGRRYPLVRVLLAPSLVQGDQAPAQIVAALQTLDRRADVDVILLVRGGGSLEELWAFNDERVARTVAACRHPVVSGVGHETDSTIADFVADLRASTPSAAAELVVPDRLDLQQRIQGSLFRLQGNLEQRLGRARQALKQQERVLLRLSPQGRVDAYRQQVDDLTRRARRAATHTLALRRSACMGFQARLEALNPLATLERGYAIVRQEATNTVVRSVEQVRAGEALIIRVHDGEFGALARNKE